MKSFRLAALCLAVVCSVTMLSSCKKEASNTAETTGQTTTTATDETTGGDNTVKNYDSSKAGYQLETPSDSDTIAIMHTNMGDIYIRLFPEEAPKTVENFVTHSKNGYYDGLTFHRVVSDFVIQGGDPNGNGTGGESIWGGNFEDEFSGNLLNLRGSLAMANSGSNTNGSQFFINQADKNTFAGWDVLEQNAANLMQSSFYDVSSVPETVRELYAQNGGNYFLDGAFRTQGGHTVFGQVYQGMDVVDAIAALDVNTSGMPYDTVTINNITITTYGEAK